MKNSLQQILKNPLFDGISISTLNSILNCIGTTEKEYKRNEFILHEGDNIELIGIVVSGSVKVIKTDLNGNEIIITEVYQGDMFGEIFACADIFHSPVSIYCDIDSSIIFFNYRKIISTCGSACQFHQKLISNMLKIIARKGLYLNQRIDIISRKTLREKIIAYFNFTSNGLKKFKIPFNREELANFLCADRSALSNELSKMQKDGLIAYNKNEFQLFF